MVKCLLVVIMGEVVALNNNLDLWNAVNTGDGEGVNQALSRGGDPNWSNPASYSKTALHMAALNNFPSIVRTLLSKGANLEARNDQGWTPLYSASRDGCNEALAVLISCGADVNAQTNNGNTALMGATLYGHLTTVEVLINAHANMTITQQAGWSVLHWAAWHNRQDIA
ncbi:unnamed protein product, partial [Meganyctiphanes norvegica]